MKIAYFTDAYLPQVNGVTFVVENHAKLLSKNNDVMIFAPSYGLRRYKETLEAGKLIIERYPSLPVINYKEIHLTFAGLPQMIISIRKFKPDVIHFASPLPIGISAVIISKLFKIPLVSTYHTLLSETLPPLPPFNSINKILTINNRKDILKNFIWDSSKKIYDYCDVIIAPTKMIKDELSKHDHKSEIVVISNGIDTKKFSYKLNRKATFKIIYVGRTSFEKNIDVVIKVFNTLLSSIPNVILEIIGDGPAMSSLKKLAKELKISKKIIFRGFVSRDKLPEYYHQSDIFVTASEMEVQPLTIMEAMSCGLPVVGVNRGGVSSLVRDNRNGYLVEPDEFEKMSNKMIKILKDNILRTKFGKESRLLAEQESYARSIEKLEKIYRRLSILTNK